MRFSTRSEYGARVLVSLARRYGSGPVPLSEIARAERLPLAYLEQIMGLLRRSGLVVSRQGVKGGFELSRPPGEVRMSEVILCLEGDISPMVCATEATGSVSLCVLEEVCSTQVLWHRIRESVLHVLETTTLADLAVPAKGSPRQRPEARPAVAAP
jgi:Rrf2 family cysteine metabolism transcriptional repressor